MRIATFNLESLGDTAGCDDGLDSRMEILRPQLMRLGADILCLQEVNGQHAKGAQHRSLVALDALLAGTPYAGFQRVSTTGPGGSGVADVHNLVTLSRWPIRAHREIRNAVLPPFQYRIVSARPPQPDAVEICFDRPILMSSITLDDATELTVINVHLKAPLASPIAGQKEAPFVWRSISGWAEGYFLSSLKRSAQALEARMVVDQLMDADPHALVVAAGDFNAEDHETPIRILVGAEDDTGNGRLGARSLTVLDRSITEDRRFTVLHHGRPQALDHILVSWPLIARFRSIEAHNESLTDEAIGYAVTRHPIASYHAPMVAEFASG